MTQATESRIVPRPRFHLAHSLIGAGALVLIELAVIYARLAANVTEALILLVAAVGSVMTIYIATEAVEEVQGKMRMFITLSAVVTEFAVFFAFEYWLLCAVQPASFPMLPHDAISMLLASVMGFVLNPLYLPATGAGKVLLLIETFGALGLVLFVLQNIGAFRKKSLDAAN